MKISLALSLLVVTVVVAFVPEQHTSRRCASSLTMGYFPDGMSAEQYRKLREKEKEQESKKELGAYGPQSFKSRSLKSFQQDLEKGISKHLLPVFSAKEKVKRGDIRPEDVPYMQRGGNWDNSDVSSAKPKTWNEADKKYTARNSPARADWTKMTGRVDTDQRKAGAAKARAANPEPPKKKLFGIF